MPDELISCLMVTLPVPARFDCLRRSIADYRRQTYRARELVILLNGGEPESSDRIRKYVDSIGDESIRVIELPGQMPMGALRNRSIAAAKGEIVCQWDDDDLYHPERLTAQAQALDDAGSDALFLRDVMQFFSGSRSLYCTNWRATEAHAFPGSVMCRRSTSVCYPESGPEMQLGEDSAFARQLWAGGTAATLDGAPHLYVYVTHGRNSWPEDHHRMLSRELALSRGLLMKREAQLREGLREIAFDPGEIVVQGYNGPAFTLQVAGPASRH